MSSNNYTQSSLFNQLDQMELAFQHLIERNVLIPGVDASALFLEETVRRTVHHIQNYYTQNNIFPSGITILVWPQKEGKLDLVQLEKSIRSTLPEYGLPVENLIRIEMAEYPSLQIGEIIILNLDPETPGRTSQMEMEALQDYSKSEPSLSTSYLIINGDQSFNFDTAVVNIGRRADNHIIIEEMTVSRLHAQIRNTNDRHIIFDLNSKSGTFVNKQRIMQWTLKPGDVITIGNVHMIYCEENPSDENRLDQTQPLPTMDGKTI